MADPYAGTGDSVDSPANHLTAVTPSDTAQLPTFLKAFMVGGSGNIRLQTPGDGAPVTIYGVNTGVIYKIRVAQVFATGTTAGNIVGLY